ncbi:MAG: aldolase, partial [Armatimonadetes bacterium]|nr:aldolase [Armatimonadota bacterium]
SYDPGVLHALKGAGYEFAVIDTQHSIQNQEALREYAAQGTHMGLPIWIRPQYTMPQFITRPLDNGVSGIMSPMMATPEEAAEIVDAAYYPPIGKR